MKWDLNLERKVLRILLEGKLKGNKIKVLIYKYKAWYHASNSGIHEILSSPIPLF